MKQIKYWVLTFAMTIFAWQSALAQEGEFSNGEIEQILAPIALYPDTVLTHILIAATYPLEVIQANRWVKDHKSLGGQAAVDGVSHFDWDPSVKALVAFPDLLDRMAGDLDWLQDLGEAFLADEGRVLDRVQVLREQAYAQGTLDDMQHLKVVRETRTIYIEPVEERVVYLPWYDPFVVYGAWHWPHYPPVAWRHSHNISYGHFYWGPRYSLSTSFYFGAIAWPRHTVVIINRDVRPKHYWAHTIAHHNHAKRWRHDPYHRRHVAYRNDRAHRVFGDPRHDSHYERPSLRREVERRGGGDRKFTQQDDGRHDRKNLATRTEGDGERNRYDRHLQGLKDRDRKVYSSDQGNRVDRNSAYQRPSTSAREERDIRQQSGNSAQRRSADAIQERLRQTSERKPTGERAKPASPNQLKRAVENTQRLERKALQPAPAAPPQRRQEVTREAPVQSTPAYRDRQDSNRHYESRPSRMDRSGIQPQRDSRATRMDRSNSRPEPRRGVERR